MLARQPVVFLSSDSLRARRARGSYCCTAQAEIRDANAGLAYFVGANPSHRPRSLQQHVNARIISWSETVTHSSFRGAPATARTRNPEVLCAITSRFRVRRHRVAPCAVQIASPRNDMRVFPRSRGAMRPRFASPSRDLREAMERREAPGHQRAPLEAGLTYPPRAARLPRAPSDVGRGASRRSTLATSLSTIPGRPGPASFRSVRLKDRL